ncbi:MAG: tRNA pseudouridine(55) synthase TruB, partial [Christensenellaceae bacterium]|nr:tRNA pseudouridine(55) synthase TruB [Christensenellaceae bacterium]
MNGIINVLKPPGMSSSGVVSYIRKITGEKRVGHAGTLDPGAAGVLPVCIGRSTRLTDMLMENRKEYIAEICFGISTDTLDSYGIV